MRSEPLKQEGYDLIGAAMDIYIYYKVQLLKSFYISDMIIYNGIVVELKTVKGLNGSNIPNLSTTYAFQGNQ